MKVPLMPNGETVQCGEGVVGVVCGLTEVVMEGQLILNGEAVQCGEVVMCGLTVPVPWRWHTLWEPTVGDCTGSQPL